MEVTVIPIVINTHGSIPEALVKGLEELEIRTQLETIQTTADYWNESRRLGRFIVTQIPVEDHQLMLVRLPLKCVKC